MEFRLLGPVEAYHEGRQVDLGRRRERCLLAILLLEVNRPVPVDRLIGLLWDGRPPASARAALHTHMSRLRGRLDPGGTGRYGIRLLTQGSGYTAVARPDTVDAHRFRSLVAAARELADPGARVATLDAALALWRGPVLADVASDDVRGRIGAALDELRAMAVESRVEAELARGRHDDVLADLTALVDAHPLRERLVALRMIALYRSGRRDEALAAYRQARARLAADLGLDPGPPLDAVHEAVLRGDPSLDLPPEPDEEDPDPVPDLVAGPHPAPSQLPPDIADFTGLAEETGRLLAALAPDAERTAVPVAVVTGKGGAGKTTLAVHVAHRLRADYPDGHLYVHLHGATRTPADPAEVLARLLRALGVGGGAALPGLEQRAERYRLALADRRVLVVLDDAADVAQIRPLLPGGPGCGVVVTSRRRLPGLAGATTVTLDTMPAAAAHALLAEIVGADRVAAEPDAAQRLVDLCGRLPLAIRIAGTRLAARPHWPVARLVDRLSDTRRRLDELAVDDLAVRASLALSYDGLPPTARRALRLLAHYDPPDFGGWLLAPLLDVPPADAEDLLDRLVEAQLVDTTGAGRRYMLHDLVALYARERAGAEDAAEQRREAVARAGLAWLAVTEAAADHLPPGTGRRYRPDLAPPPAVDAVASRPWFEAEEAALVAAVERAAASGLHAHAAALAEALVAGYGGVNNAFDAWHRTHRAALAAAQQAGDTPAVAAMRCGLGQLRYQQDRYAEAAAHFSAARELYVGIADAVGAAVAGNGLGMVARETGDHGTALPLLTEARDVLTALGDHEGAAHALYGIGYCHRELGHDEQAVAALTAAADTYRGLRHLRGEALAWRGIGLVHRARGELDAAETHCQRAYAMLRALDDRLYTAYAGQALAKIWLRQGRYERAATTLRACLRTCTRYRDRLGVALVTRTVGELDLAAGRPERAIGALREALVAFDGLGLPLWCARTQRDLGAALHATGHRDAAHAVWRSAAAVFARLGTRESAELPSWRRRAGCDCPS